MLSFPAGMSDEEINKVGLMPDGQYQFKVIEATSKTSKSGNSMIEIVLDVYHKSENRYIKITDYLLTSSKQMMFKLKHFCFATGLNEKFNEGNLSAKDCLGRAGVVLIGIQEGQPKEGGGFYSDKNVVVDYPKDDDLEVKDKNDFVDDKDVPF